ncbi:MAG: PIN domain-containing protein [Candidatus Aenigmarchaeota archaeon]|nr:PIN domain-containing protein [Candidatus Aenigmarchaeota archaeon]
MDVAYFFDTYALIEVAKGSPSYRPYRGVQAITTKLHLLELYFAFCRERQREQGKRLFGELSGICIAIPDEVLLTAAEMRLAFLKQDLSYVDCIGYMLSRHLGIRFLTGDSKFRDKEQVAFVQ